MNNSVIGSITSNLKSKNMQNTMRANKNYNSNLVADFVLATYFYNFLCNESDVLPSYEDLNNILSHHFKKNSSLVSYYMGLTVSYLRNGLIEDKNDLIYIEFVQPINDLTQRIEKISANTHQAYITSRNGDIGMNPVNININKNPIFDKQRVRTLQEYLNEYISEYKENKSK